MAGKGRPRQDHLQHGSALSAIGMGKAVADVTKPPAEQNETSEPVESRKQQKMVLPSTLKGQHNVTHTCFLSEQRQNQRANAESQTPFKTCKSWSNLTEE